VQLNGGFLEERELNEKNRPCTKGTSGSMSPQKTQKENLRMPGGGVCAILREH